MNFNFPLVLLLLSSIPLWMVNFLHLAGGLFVLFLAYGAFQSFRNYNISTAGFQHSRRQNFFKAVLVNLLNPNPYLSWSLVMGPMLLKGWREAPADGIALVVSFYLAMILVNAAIILLFAGIGRFKSGISRALIAVSAAALGGFGVYQLWLGISGLASV